MDCFTHHTAYEINLTPDVGSNLSIAFNSPIFPSDIMSNKSRSTIYTGVTNNVYYRAFQHKNNMGSVFTKRYNCTDLIYYEFHSRIEDAITREKQIKKWKREWKNNLIAEFNPLLKDLFSESEDMI